MKRPRSPELAQGPRTCGQLVQRPSDSEGNPPAMLRHMNPLRGALEKLATQPFFEFADLLGDGARRHIELLRSGCESTEAGGRLEDAQGP